MKKITLIIFLIFSPLVFGQQLEGNYSGFFAASNFSYDFDGKGSFEFVTTGHIGNTITKGKYQIEGDTVYLKGNRTEKETLDFKMLIDKDSCIIDLQMRYDFCKSRNSEFSNSNKRNFRFPQTKSNNTKIISDLKNVLKLAFTNPKVDAYMHFESLPERKFVFKPYYEFNQSNFPNLVIGNRKVLFEQIELPEFYVDFVEINQSKNIIEIEFEIKAEGVNFKMKYVMTDGEWILDSESHHEK